jgi:hypothetical protein
MIKLRGNVYNFITLLFLSLSLPGYLYPQNLDSLFNAYVESYSRRTWIKHHPNIQSAHHREKCGFGINALITGHFNSFTNDQQNTLKKLMRRLDTLHTSMVSPSGFFRIHYDTVGYNAPGYFTEPGLNNREIVKMSIDSLAAALDSAYNFEINILGYKPPPADNGEGGDDLYDVYLAYLGPNDYGVTKFATGFASSYIEIHNSFSGFFSPGIDGAKVTAAHEFFHAIQIAQFGWKGDSQKYFYELCSTAMEEFVFDSINEYYRDLADYFRKPHYSLVGDSKRGYEDAIFLIYLHERFVKDESNWSKGYQIIKDAWRIFSQNGIAIEALAESLFNNGTSLRYEMNNFGIWCYFTSGRTKPGMYFDEAEFYPLITPFTSYVFDSPRKEYSIGTNPVSNNYLVFILTDQGFRDSLVTIITNADVAGAVSSGPGNTELRYTLTTGNEPGSQKIVNNYYSILDAPTDDLFLEANIFNDGVVSNYNFVRETLDYSFPQPFRYSEHSHLFIPVRPNTLEIADLNIYTSGMNLIYSARKEIIAGEKIVVKWDGLDTYGNKLPTGIYFYTVKSKDEFTKGKLVIYND